LLRSPFRIFFLTSFSLFRRGLTLFVYLMSEFFLCAFLSFPPTSQPFSFFSICLPRPLSFSTQMLHPSATTSFSTPSFLFSCWHSPLGPCLLRLRTHPRGLLARCSPLCFPSPPRPAVYFFPEEACLGGFKCVGVSWVPPAFLLLFPRLMSATFFLP